VEKLNREILRAELERDEGFRSKTYKCTAGFDTVGIGRNLDAVGLLPAEKAAGMTLHKIQKFGVTKAQAYTMLDNDIERFMRDLDFNVRWWRKLDPVRQRVLLNMAFNMGASAPGKGLLSFKNTLRLIETGQYAEAADNMLKSKWAVQVKGRATRLADLMRKGPKV
jgi:lysozyme